MPGQLLEQVGAHQGGNGGWCRRPGSGSARPRSNTLIGQGQGPPGYGARRTPPDSGKVTATQSAAVFGPARDSLVHEWRKLPLSANVFRALKQGWGRCRRSLGWFVELDAPAASAGPLRPSSIAGSWGRVKPAGPGCPLAAEELPFTQTESSTVLTRATAGHQGIRAPDRNSQGVAPCRRG